MGVVVMTSGGTREKRLYLLHIGFEPVRLKAVLQHRRIGKEFKETNCIFISAYRGLVGTEAPQKSKNAFRYTYPKALLNAVRAIRQLQAFGFRNIALPPGPIALFLLSNADSGLQKWRMANISIKVKKYSQIYVGLGEVGKYFFLTFTPLSRLLFFEQTPMLLKVLAIGRKGSAITA